MAVILPVLAACGLAAGAAWAGEPEPAPLPVPERSVRELTQGESGVYRWPIVKVIDGDTIKVDARGDFPPELATLNVRLRGVDTPEKGGRVLADVSVAGRSLADRLIIEGHGRAYDGGKRKPWC